MSPSWAPAYGATCIKSPNPAVSRTYRHSEFLNADSGIQVSIAYFRSSKLKYVNTYLVLYVYIHMDPGIDASSWAAASS